MILWIDNLFFAIGAIAATFLLQVIVDKFCNKVLHPIAKKTRTKFDDEFLPLLNRILTIGLWIAGIVTVCLRLGVNIKGLTAFAGLLTAIFTLILKDSVINIHSGVVIMFDKPFRVGDLITLPSGETGKVLKIGIRRTRILIENRDRLGKFNKAHLILPNSDVSKCKIINYTYAEEK